MTSFSMNAGDTGFTAASSRTYKENLEQVEVSDILERIGEIDLYKYEFIDGQKDKLGLMAEDFHRIFGRGSDKVINGQETDMALWLAVQKLIQRNNELIGRVDDLEARLRKAGATQ